MFLIKLYLLTPNRILFSQPISELSQQIEVINRKRKASGLPWILVHTDAAQMIGKGRVDVQDLGVDYLTIVGHKVYFSLFGLLSPCCDLF